MNTTIALISALLGFAMALAVLWRDHRLTAHLAFGAGIALLAGEAVFTALSFDSPRIYVWQHARLVCSAFLPGVWLIFSLAYGRGNHREFLQRWRLTIITLLVAGPGLAIIGFPFEPKLLQSKSGHWLIPLSPAGYYLNLFFLVSLVLILMNLERTFRAAVGIMRWRIKFMVLGLGVLLVVRAYTSTQMML
ncbi:MAG TPA: hypothetical protein VF607_15665, partial [Verrucomicrobiae bacterium]